MKVSISKVNHPEVYIIRIDGEYKGRLIRSNEIGPLWADKELNGFLGEPFTCDKRNEYEALKEFEDLVQKKAKEKAGVIWCEMINKFVDDARGCSCTPDTGCTFNTHSGAEHYRGA